MMVCGSTFQARFLPRVEAGPEPSAHMKPNVDGPELRVLVVDDNVDAATSLSYLLQLLGCKTAVAFGGEMALTVAKLLRPSLVFLDLDMPGRDGCEVLKLMRDLDDRLREALYVCLTGRSDPSDKERCTAAGFDIFVSKPLEPVMLGELLDQARSRRKQSIVGGR